MRVCTGTPPTAFSIVELFFYCMPAACRVEEERDRIRGVRSESLQVPSLSATFHNNNY